MKSWRAVSSLTQEEYAEVMSFRLGFLKPRSSSILNELEELKPLGLYPSGLREQSGNTESEVNTANSLFEGKGPEEGAVVSQGFLYRRETYFNGNNK